MSEPCSHTFRDSNCCSKCQVHVSVLKLEGRMTGLELALSVLTEALSPVSGQNMFERLVDVEKQLQQVLSLAGRVKLAEGLVGVSREQSSNEGRQIQALNDLNELRLQERSSMRDLLTDVHAVLQHELRVLHGMNGRDATLDGQRLTSLMNRVDTTRRALQS